ncbi:hypothetical protein [Moraxella lacunata]|uniref:hypothetical protein n=1 Tax=Moraxella lacunata TaxID=477 RepID=UPI003EE0E2BB
MGKMIKFGIITHFSFIVYHHDHQTSPIYHPNPIYRSNAHHDRLTACWMQPKQQYQHRQYNSHLRPNPRGKCRANKQCPCPQ